MSVEEAINTVGKVRSALEGVIRGRADTINLVLSSLIARGHCLIEDYPGSGKTTLAKALGGAIDCSEVEGKGIAPFRRIQFTPDLLPSDVLGVTIYDAGKKEFRFQEGPVFACIVLADEINRTGPKVQSAFLECMAEQQVTIDNTTYPLDDLFFVLATQNPIDLAGTYPLPVVQLDRFLLKIPMSYVGEKEELQILQESSKIESALEALKPVVKKSEILSAQAAVKEVHMEEKVLESVLKIVRASRSYSGFEFGASTRAAIMFKRVLGSWAICHGKDYVSEDDVKSLAPYVLRHRVLPNRTTEEAEEVFSRFLEVQVDPLISAA